MTNKLEMERHFSTFLQETEPNLIELLEKLKSVFRQFTENKLVEENDSIMNHIIIRTKVDEDDSLVISINAKSKVGEDLLNSITTNKGINNEE